MVARTGWGEDAVIAEMKINEYNFVNHQHLDAGAFQIYYKGALAIDSGLYSGSSGEYGSPHCRNYYWRTIAHNCLLVHDPEEKFGRRGYGNDGGQRLPNGRCEPRNLDVLLAPENGYRTGKVLAHGFGPDPQTPDLHAAARRHHRGLRPEGQAGHPLVRLPQSPRRASARGDGRVRPRGQRRSRLPQVLAAALDGGTAAGWGFGDGGLHAARRTRPAESRRAAAPRPTRPWRKVGGPGKEYWVFGTNYANDPDPTRAGEARWKPPPGGWSFRRRLPPPRTAFWP